jgi:hypothetical protein
MLTFKTCGSIKTNQGMKSKKNTIKKIQNKINISKKKWGDKFDMRKN